jgi:CRISPR-associated protein Cas5h
VSGPWAHFRRVEGNIVKQTYRIIPRTTVAGLVAAILGIGRDRYYHLFDPEESAVAVQPTAELRTINMPMNTLSTAKEDIRNVPKRGNRRIGFPDPSKPRQQHNYEVLVDPAYRIDLWLEDRNVYDDLRSALVEGTSYYVPSLGLSEHLATVKFHDDYEVEDGAVEDEIQVDSVVVDAVDSIVLERETECRMERSPGFMEAADGGRRTTAFLSYAYNPAGEPLTVRDVQTATVDGRTVMFS